MHRYTSIMTFSPHGKKNRKKMNSITKMTGFHRQFWCSKGGHGNPSPSYPFVLGLPVARVIEVVDIVDVLGHFSASGLGVRESKKFYIFTGNKPDVAEDEICAAYDDLYDQEEAACPFHSAVSLPKRVLCVRGKYVGYTPRSFSMPHHTTHLFNGVGRLRFEYSL